jgi:hypothetical protein
MLDIAREFADKVNSMPKYVVTTTLDELERDNSTPIKGAVPSPPCSPTSPTVRSSAASPRSPADRSCAGRTIGVGAR